MNPIDTVLRFFTSIGQQIITVIPGILGAAGLMLVGWLLAKVASNAIIRILQRIGIKKLNERLKTIDIFANLDIDLAAVIGRVLYWAVILIFMTAASEAAGLTTISQCIGRLGGYIPQ